MQTVSHEGMVLDAVNEPPKRREYHRIILNFPPELAARVREAADSERRSLTGQIQVMVERQLAHDQAA